MQLSQIQILLNYDSTILLVYTCQRPKATGCDMLIWEDNARVREREFAFRNQLFKPVISSRIPVKGFESLITLPNTVEKENSTSYNLQFISSSTPSKSSKNTKSLNLDFKTTQKDDDDDESSYDWSPSADEELYKILPNDIMIPDSLPRKVMKVETLSTHSKFNTKMEKNPLQQEDIPTRSITPTPMMPNPFPNENLPLLAEIPTSVSLRDYSRQQSDLATQLLHVFEENKIPLGTEAKEEVLEIASKHDRGRQIKMGRDVSRVAITKNSEEIAKLQERIIQLEADRQLLQEFAQSQDDGL